MKRPWNRTDQPVYSIASRFENRSNMHIISYVSAISMEPKLYACAVYKSTLTLELLQSSKTCVLQLLSCTQERLVPVLGKRSGYDFDKLTWLNQRHLLTEWNGFAVLKDALAWIQLDLFQEVDTGGDHVLMIGRVVRWKNQQPGTPLGLDQLRGRGLIRG